MTEEYLIQSGGMALTRTDFLIRMLVAIGIGLVTGLEREFSSVNKKAEFAGLRTLSIISILGFTGAFLNYVIHPFVFLMGLGGVMVIVFIYYWNTAKKGEFGSTTEFSAILVYLLGGLTFMGYMEMSLAMMVMLVVLLSLKEQFHHIIGHINQTEITAFVRFVVLSLLILPFLPDNHFGPYHVLNPREIGWIIVLTSGISFIGYILMKLLGPNKGVLFTGIVGGLISSTAVTWTFAKKSKTNPAFSSTYAIAIFAAASVMVIRVGVWLMIFNSEMLNDLLIPLIIILLASLGVTLYFYRAKSDAVVSENEIQTGEPLNIKDGIVFGLLYAGILLGVSHANAMYGEGGIYFSSVLSGLTDLDAIAISVAKLGGSSILFLTAQNALLAATVANTVVKLSIAIYGGSSALKKKVSYGYGFILVSAILGFIVLNF